MKLYSEKQLDKYLVKRPKVKVLNFPRFAGDDPRRVQKKWESALRSTKIIREITIDASS